MVSRSSRPPLGSVFSLSPSGTLCVSRRDGHVCRLSHGLDDSRARPPPPPAALASSHDSLQALAELVCRRAQQGPGRRRCRRHWLPALLRSSSGALLAHGACRRSPVPQPPLCSQRDPTHALEIRRRVALELAQLLRSGARRGHGRRGWRRSRWEVRPRARPRRIELPARLADERGSAVLVVL